MTPKEKAEMLIAKYSVWTSRGNTPEYMHYDAKQCALICVEELKQQALSFDYYKSIESTNYLWELKQEIEKL